MTPKRRRRSFKLLVCPSCGKFGTLQRIIYGMPAPVTFDFEEYSVGGSCMNCDGSDLDILCGEYDWTGFHNSLEGS